MMSIMMILGKKYVKVINRRKSVAISRVLLKERYSNLSIEELEERYNNLKKRITFNSKEEFIMDYLGNILNGSKDVNIESEKVALEELLKEKTGRKYHIEPTRFAFELIDVINVIANNDSVLFTTLNNFFNELNKISEKDKIKFISELYQDKSSFNEFIKEIVQSNDYKEIFKKYQKIATDYIRFNTFIG